MGSIIATNGIQLIDKASVAILFGFRQKKTGFRRSELREETHEKACLASIYDRNRDLIRAKPRKHIGRSEMGFVRICQLKTDLGSDPVQGVVDIFQSLTTK